MQAEPDRDRGARLLQFVSWFREKQEGGSPTHNMRAAELPTGLEETEVSGTNFSVESEGSEEERRGQSTQAQPCAPVDPVVRDRIVRSFSVAISLSFVSFTVHTRLVDPQDVVKWLKRYQPWSFSVSMIHNVYEVEVRRDDNHSRRTWSDQQWIDEIVTWLATLEVEYWGPRAT